jgi:general secretion pathway protein G
MSSQSVVSRRGQAGFSLLELMIVLGIVSVLAAVLIPNVQRHMQAARVAAAISDLRCIQGALTQYGLRNPDAPIPQNMSNYSAVAAMSSANGCWMPPIGDRQNPRRPWDPWNFFCTIWSNGVITLLPCDSIAPQPQGYELYIQTQNVAPDYPGAVVLLSSDRNIHAYTMSEAQLQVGALHP